MGKVKVLIVEDEMIISTGLKLGVLKAGYELVGQAINYSEAIEIFETNPPDITLLDIQLSGKKSGIDLAKEINLKYKSPFIYVTSFSDSNTVEEAKFTEPSAYLVKPFNQAELFTSIEIALFNYSKKIDQVISTNHIVIQDSLFVKIDKHFIRLYFEDIIFIKSSHIYIEIVMKDEVKHLVRGSLNEYTNKLSSAFFRCHRSYIVNTAYLSSITHNELTAMEYKIPVSKKNREDLVAMLNL